MKKEACEIFEDAHFPLCKWSSNDLEMMNRWDPTREVRELKVLGINWDLIEDILALHVDWEASTEPWTQRRLMKLIGSIFDPLGIAEP